MLTSTIRPRVDDLGPARHVHNTVLPAWFQEARNELLRTFSNPEAPNPTPLMIKEYTVTFHQELVLVPDVVIDVEVERVGNSSFILQEAASQGSQLAAESRVVYVYVGVDNRPTTIPGHLRAYLEQHRARMPVS